MKKNGLIAMLVITLLTIPIGVHAKYDCFLRIAGVQGEATDDKHRGWVDILWFEQGIEQSQGLRIGGAGAPVQRAKHSGLTVRKAVDRTSPILLDYCNSSRQISEVTLECVRAAGEKVIFYTIRLRNVLVTRIQITGEVSGALAKPVEEINFAYSAIEWKYIPMDARTGRTEAAVGSGWDLQRNAPIPVR